jgi:hypothetical protein
VGAIVNSYRKTISDAKLFALVALMVLGMACGFVTTAFSQTVSKYQAGTIVEVKLHDPAGASNSGKLYDISVQVGNTMYVVLYTAPAGSNVVEYKAGLGTNVLVQGKTLKVNDQTGRTIVVPILSRKELKSNKTQ